MKTLKDLDRVFETDFDVLFVGIEITGLKNAAREEIKRLSKDKNNTIKRLKKQAKEWDVLYEKGAVDDYNAAQVQLNFIEYEDSNWYKEENAQIKWIKHFFNLEDE